MAPLDNTYWVPTPVRPYIPHPIEFEPDDFFQPQIGQDDYEWDTYDDSEEYLGYPSYDDYIDCYVKVKTYLALCLATLFWTWKISYLNFPFLKRKTFLGIYLGIIFFRMLGMIIGMRKLNWKASHMGFMVFVWLWIHHIPRRA